MHPFNFKHCALQAVMSFWMFLARDLLNMYFPDYTHACVQTHPTVAAAAAAAAAAETAAE
jgi:hypothetical protein